MFFSKRKTSSRNSQNFSSLSRSYRRPVVGSRKNFRNINPEKKASIKAFFIKTCGIIIVAGAAYFFYFSGYFNISNIEIKYQSLQTKKEELKNYFKPFLGKNIFSVDLKKTVEKIKSDFPDFESIKASTKFPRMIEIQFTKFPEKASIEWITDQENRKVVVNAIGSVVQEGKGDASLPTIRIFAEGEFPEKGPLIPKEKISYIVDTMKFFEEKFGMKITEAQYLVRAREIHLRTERLFLIWLDTEIPFEQQFAKLKKALPKLDIYHENLEYIDLRISGINGEKIIFKRGK
ncbi:MAG: hypothetical protein AAB551_02875 [Patescibacteria group bacterium]